MAGKRYTAEDIICHLRTVEIEAGKGPWVADPCRKLGVTEQTYHRCENEYSGFCVEQENAQLNRLVADLSLDKHMLPEAPQEESTVRTPSRTGRLASGHVPGQLPAGLPLGPVWPGLPDGSFAQFC